MLTGWDERGKRAGSVHFMITSLRVNPALEPARFTIPIGQARVVIDEDAHSFLKHPLLKQDW